MYNWKLTLAAAEFAQRAHEFHGQKRKYTGDPYFVHCVDVACLLVNYVVDLPEEVRAAAYLHDVIEDVPEVSIEVIEMLFGKKVRDLVAEVTDVSKPSDGNRAERKRIDREHLAKASYWGATIKYADLISNTRDIAKNDPGFGRTYLKEKKLLLGVMKQGHSGMYRLALDVLKQAWRDVFSEEFPE